MAEPAANQGIVESLVQMVNEFSAIAAESYVQAVLLALGALIILFSMAVFGVLTLGAVLSALKGLLPSGSRPPQTR